MNNTANHRNERRNRRCKFCVYMKKIGPVNMPPCIPDVWQCSVTEKRVKPDDRRPFCKHYKVNMKECNTIEARAMLLSLIDKENITDNQI